MTRCPVTSGSSGMMRSATGRWRRMGQVWNIGRSFVPFAVAMRATVSATPKLPASIATTLPAQPSGTRTLVEDERRLLDLAEDVPLLDLVAGLARGLELPDPGPVERRHLDAAGDEVARLRPDAVERPLDAVVDGAEQARPELDAQRPPGQRDRLSRPDAGRVLVDLDVGPVFLELDDLADEAERPDLDHVVHLGALAVGGDDERPGHANDLSLLHVHPFRFTSASEPVARTAISFSMTSRWSEAVL